MTSWRELAAQALATPDVALAADAPRVSAEVLDGLKRLQRMPPPRRLKNHGAWAEVIADAAAIATHGWADQAVMLGWHPLDLFGCGLASDEPFESLAIWLRGGALVLLDEQTAIARTGNKHRVFYRPNHRRRHGRLLFLWNAGETHQQRGEGQ